MSASASGAQTGKTYKELLQKHRMETAARLLRRSDLNIQQIITQVGYENTSYFYRLFHERYGVRAPGSTAGHAASAHKCISERPSPPLQQALTERAVLCYIKAERSGRAAACRKRGWMTMFRGARRADLDAILKIYARARQAMADSGNPTQWGDHFPPQELLEEDIEALP